MTKYELKRILEKLDLGKIQNITKIQKMKTRYSNVYYSTLNYESKYKNLILSILRGEEMSIVYEFPWFINMKILAGGGESPR